MDKKDLLLAIDAGNTNVVFAVFDGAELVDQWRTSTNPRRTAEEYAVWLTQLMSLDGISPGAISAAVIATVVPQALFAVETLCRRFFRCVPLIVGDGTDLGIEVHITRPAEVGADRLVNAVAAHERYQDWLIVVDFGTATTLDVVSPDGHYEGGVIAPGVNLSIDALERAAARLPRVSVERTDKVIGKGTVEAMQSGVYWGYVGLIEGLIGRIKTEVGKPMKVVATGGLAPLFNEAADCIDVVESDLILHGLRLVHDRNQRDEAT